MQKVIRKTTTFVLVLALIMSVIPAMSGVTDEVQAATAIDYKLDFTEDSTATSGVGYNWDKNTRTLKLNNFNMSLSGLVDDDENDNDYLIFLPTNSSIVLTGTNIITGRGNNFGCIGAHKGLKISGSGSLNIDCEVSNQQYPDGAYSLGMGIDGTLTVDNVSINIKSNTCGIMSNGGVIVNNGKVVCTANESNEGEGIMAFGINCEYLELNKGDIFTSSSKYYGIFCHGETYPSLNVKEGTLTMAGSKSVFFTEGMTLPSISLPDAYKYKFSTTSHTGTNDAYISYSKTNGGTAYAPDASHKYVTITTEKDAPLKGTKFNSGKYGYKITDAKTDGSGEVAVTGFAGGKAVSDLKIGKTVKYEGYTYKVTSIANKAFKGSKKIKSVTVGNNVKSIGSFAFYKNKNLKSITIGTKVTKIGKHVFCHDKKLRTITIKSKKLKSVGKHVLFKTKDLKIKAPASKVKKYKKLFKNKGQNKSANVRVVKK